MLVWLDVNLLVSSDKVPLCWASICNPQTK